MTSKLSVLGTAAALGMLLAVSGCGSSDGAPGSTANNSGVAPGGQPQTSATDAFISRVMAVIGSTSETDEPADIKSITVTTPEDAEPVPVS